MNPHTAQTATTSETERNPRTWRVTWPDETRDFYRGTHAYTDPNSCLYIMRSDEDGKTVMAAVVNPAHTREILEILPRDNEGWGGAL